MKKLLLLLSAVIAAMGAGAQPLDDLQIFSKPGKRAMNHMVVQLKGDNGLSIIDANGNIKARNFAPVVNSKGQVKANNYSSPVIDSVFCVVRYKKTIGDNESRRSCTVYYGIDDPKPVPGLEDLYAADIIDPDLFPVSRQGERIKFVDKHGNVKFTVGTHGRIEPREVHPVAIYGMVMVEMTTGMMGILNTKGEWVVRPQWDYVEILEDEGSFVGWLDGKSWKINRDGTTEILDGEFSFSKGYMMEKAYNRFGPLINIYDSNRHYITTIQDAINAHPCVSNPNIFLVIHRPGQEYLVDITKEGKKLTDEYSYIEELPDGAFFGVKKLSGDLHKSVKFTLNGNVTPMPDNSRFVIRHPGMLQFYDSDIYLFYTEPTDDGRPGYFYDKNGNKLSNIPFTEYFNREWEAEPVHSGIER